MYLLMLKNKLYFSNEAVMNHFFFKFNIYHILKQSIRGSLQ